MDKKEKILIIRFSSFGDVTQALSLPSLLKKKFPAAEIHWVLRQDLSELVIHHPDIDKVWTLDRKQGFKALLQITWTLYREHFTRIYDAHNSTRSHFISLFLRWPWGVHFVRKAQFRIKRFFLFHWHINLYPMPFSGQRDLIAPLKKWGLTEELPPPPQLFLSDRDQKKIQELSLPEPYIAIAPSAAFTLKRWPLEHWMALIRMNPEKKFIVLGGREDQFLTVLQDQFPEQVINLAGKLSLLESAAVIEKARVVISNDTGLLHVAEQLGKKTIALMGPAPFGYPSRETTKILELQLPCKPCSKHGQGPCVNKTFHKCLREITPVWVHETLRNLWA